MSPSETSATMGVIASAPVVRGRDAELAAIGFSWTACAPERALPCWSRASRAWARAGCSPSRRASLGGWDFASARASRSRTRGRWSLAPLMTALFDGPDPLLNRADPHDLRSVADQRYWLLPVGHFPPNGGRVVFELINIFRYDDQGRLAE